MSPPADADLVVVGAGVIGTSVAYHAARAGHSVVVLEKEPAAAMHQSGRSSGVIHAGYNLKPGSTKARYCVEGSRRLRAYCQENGVAMTQGGILVTATNEAQLDSLQTLHGHGKKNGVDVRLVDEQGIKEIEPHAAGIQALHAPEGASLDGAGYVRRLQADAEAAGAKFRFGVRVQDLPAAGGVQTDTGIVQGRVVVNAAGLFADRLAGHVETDLRVIPFRGYYAELRPEARKLVRSHIYAAPDPRFPFLGVHLSKRFDGAVTAGPGAMLAFGREAYRFWGVNFRDLSGTLAWPGFWRLVGQKAFRSRIRSEVQKSLSTTEIWRESTALLPALARKDVVPGGPHRAGNRAQMVDREGNLVDDILVKETEDAVHVLNAVSPGLTCSLPFGEDLANRAAALL